jgi:hypothetical protein
VIRGACCAGFILVFLHRRSCRRSGRSPPVCPVSETELFVALRESLG